MKSLIYLVHNLYKSEFCTKRKSFIFQISKLQVISLTLHILYIEFQQYFIRRNICFFCVYTICIPTYMFTKKILDKNQHVENMCKRNLKQNLYETKNFVDDFCLHFLLYVRTLYIYVYSYLYGYKKLKENIMCNYYIPCV